jgi:phosphoglycolate phosphatase
MHDAVLFDLDGTLIDTAPEIADAVNMTLRRLSLPQASRAQVRDWIGDGTRALLTKALAASGVAAASVPTTLQRAWPGFELDYQECCGTSSLPYPGALRMLHRLREANVRCALVTNKEAAFSHRLLVRHELTDLFDVLVCGDTLSVRKPDPAMAIHALDALGALGDRALFIGDSVVDVRTARAAGLPVWAMRHGYGLAGMTGNDEPDRFITHFDEVADALAVEREARISIF